MLHLTEEYWGKFKQDGQLFEKLVGELLSLEYPGKVFRQTKATHDGNRDWELEIPLLHDQSVDIWFECKYHKDTLAAEDVSMTLVMAYVEDAKQIVFFSYSPVNREFAKKMSRFSEHSKIPIFVYADLELETLILKNWNQLNVTEYFMGAKPEAKNCLLKEISAYNETYLNGHLISCHKENELPIVRFNDILMFRITLVNHNSTNNQTVSVSLPPNVENNFIICDENFVAADNQASINVLHNGINSFSLHLKLRRFGPSIKLPSIIIEWGGKRKILRPGTVEGQWLAEAPLIGQIFHDIVFDQTQFMKNQSFVFSQVIGHSGVGKSRLIHEISTQAHILGKQVFWLDNDLEKTDFSSFVRRLVSCLVGLPRLSPRKSIHFLGSSNKFHNMSAQILYNNTYLAKLSLKELSVFLFMLMQEKKIWLILDNVQWMDERSLELLEYLLTYTGKHSYSGVFLTFNQDYLYSGTKADQLFKKTQIYSTQYCGYVQSKEITGFTHADALTYLRECLTYHSKSYSDELDYSETLEKVIDYCGTQPFYLKNMLIYLYQKHVLERTDESSFYVASISDFWKYVQEVPKTVLALLEQRIRLTEEYFKKKGDERLFQDLCKILSFCNVIPAVLCRELFGVFQIKHELTDLGILTINGKGEISFYHQYFEQYFKKIYPLEQLPQQLLETFCAAILKRQLKEQMLETYYLAQYTMGTCENALLKQMMERIVAWQVSPQLSQAVKQAVFAQLLYLSETFPDRLVASCYYAMCFMTANREGMQEACSYYEYCYLDLIHGGKSYVSHRDLIFPLIREYLLSLGNLNCNQKALDCAYELLNHTISSSEYCTVREILCISNYAMGQTQDAVREIKDALTYKLTNEDKYKLIQEYGKAYYYDSNAYQYRIQICEQWDTAFELYKKHWAGRSNSHDLSFLQREISAWLNAGISDLIQNKIAAAEEKMLYLSQYLDCTRMPYYEIKIRLFRALVLLLISMENKKTGQFYDEICTLLSNAGDICVVYCNMQDYPLCFYLRASVQLYAGRYNEAADNYKKTCVVLQKTIDNPKEESIWSYFYEDMALRFAQLHIEFPQELLYGIRSAKLREKIQKLKNCDDPEDEIILCDRSPILYGGGPWGLPKI